MIIALEGNVNTGKTTFANRYIKQHPEFVLISETPFKEGLSQFELQEYYINEEIKKAKNVSPNTITDRSIFSTLAYTYYTDLLNKQDKEYFIRKISKLIKKRKVIIPEQIYFLLLPYNQINGYYEENAEFKKTQKSLVKYDYYLFYNKFFLGNTLKKEIVESSYLRQIIKLDGKAFANCFIENQNNYTNIKFMKSWTPNVFDISEFKKRYFIDKNEIDFDFLYSFFYISDKLSTTKRKEFINEISKNINIAISFDYKSVVAFLKNYNFEALKLDFNFDIEEILLIDILEGYGGNKC